MNSKILYLFLFGMILATFISTAASLNININNNGKESDGANGDGITSNECEICELVVKDVIDCLTSNMTVKEIETGLDLLCWRIMPFHSRPCRQFVNSNIERIIEIIEDNGDPNEVCSKLGACSSSENSNNNNNNNKLINKQDNNKFFPNNNYQ